MKRYKMNLTSSQSLKLKIDLGLNGKIKSIELRIDDNGLCDFIIDLFNEEFNTFREALIIEQSESRFKMLTNFMKPFIRDYKIEEILR